MSDTRAEITIRHHVQGQGGKYVAHLDGEKHTGTLEWEQRHGSSGEDIHIATHTIVPKQIGGRGVAAQLVERLIADARQYGFCIEPRCSYVAAKFDENPEWADLRAG